jgi:hypothetical protein
MNKRELVDAVAAATGESKAADHGPAARPCAHRARRRRSARATGDDLIARHHGPDIFKRREVGRPARLGAQLF